MANIIRYLPKFGLIGLFTGIAIFALGAAALVSANEWWMSIMWGIALCALAWAMVNVIYQSKANRPYWIGFLIFGGGYMLLYLMASQPSFNGTSSRTDALQIDQIFTTNVLEAAYTTLVPESRQQPHANGTATWSNLLIQPAPAAPFVFSGTPGPYATWPSPSTIAFTGTPTSTVWLGPANNPQYMDQRIFLATGHALWTLVLAMIGGFVTVRVVLFASQPREQQAQVAAGKAAYPQGVHPLDARDSPFKSSEETQEA